MKDHAGVFVPPPLLFALPLLGAIILQSRRPWLMVEGGSTSLVVGGFAAIGGAIALVLASIAIFRQAATTILPAGRPTTAIVERGPYRVTRNPMYLAMAIAYCGVSMALNNFWAIVFLPAILAIVDVFVIRREERYLTSKFGQTYRDYCSRVRRWL